MKNKRKFFISFFMIVMIISCNKDKPQDLSVLPDLIPYRVGNKMGYCDKKGNIIVETKYDEVERFSEGFAGVMQNAKYGFIDLSGKEITEIAYDATRPFYHNLAPVCIKDK
jgi:hypothetical protein